MTEILQQFEPRYRHLIEDGWTVQTYCKANEGISIIFTAYPENISEEKYTSLYSFPEMQRHFLDNKMYFLLIIDFV